LSKFLIPQLTAEATAAWKENFLNVLCENIDSLLYVFF
jgi:hypothetical protein